MFSEKINYNFNNLIIVFMIIITVFLITLVTFSIKSLNLSYIYLSLISLVLVVNSVNSKNAATISLNMLFYLGFFFKISVIIIFSNSIGKNIFFEESLITIDINSKFFKDILNKLSIFFLIVFLSEYLISKLIKINYKNGLSNFSSFIKNNKYLIIFTLLFFITFLNFINFYYGISFRGNLKNDNIFSLIIKVFNFFVTSSIICLIIDIELSKRNIKNTFYFFLIFIFSSILNHLTILSRSGIFEILVILYLLMNNDFKKGFSLLLLSSILWFCSIEAVNELRKNNYVENRFDFIDFKINKETKYKKTVNDTDNKAEKTIQKKDESNLKNDEDFFQIKTIKSSQFSYLMIYRWVGIDSFINTELNENKSFKLFYEALVEKYEYGKYTFYENYFYKKPNKEVYNQVFIPGIVAFLNYTGNNFLFYFSGFLLMLFILLTQKFINELTFNASYFSSFLMFVISWRIIHFGISPINTLKYIFLIILYVIFVRLLLNIFKYFYIDKGLR